MGIIIPQVRLYQHPESEHAKQSQGQGLLDGKNIPPNPEKSYRNSFDFNRRIIATVDGKR
jgi:hypothetical protein